ncbi:MAG: hypothetical protein SGPRY_005757 [Prymnesium sp.]
MRPREAEPSARELSRLRGGLPLGLPPAASPSSTFRAFRTLLNLTQKEFGTLISLERAPISASVICQLETGVQPISASLFRLAATCTAAVHCFAEWRVEELLGCHDSTLSALRALGAGCEAELPRYTAKQAGLSESDRALLAKYLALVSQRKQARLCDRPATRGPYKKSARVSHVGQGAKGKRDGKAADRGKRFPQAVALQGCDSEGISTPTSSDRSSERSAAPTLPSSPGIGLHELSLLDELSPTHACTSAPHAGTSFLDRLEDAERRDQLTLQSAQANGVGLGAHSCTELDGSLPSNSMSCRSPRASPRSGESSKRQNTRSACAMGDGDLMRDVVLSVVDLDKLNLDDLCLDDFTQSTICEATSPAFDEIIDMFCYELAGPTSPAVNGSNAFEC